ncbi:4276_t:CDS:2 [Funneliformis caledonium]|uniref:Derlin n=1 Tax=Funneliformis caledonium TaxID=1117310 RepID=A0A9N9F4P1_9GLOM|nr:4276_t:CDS:2 [Funneliformis caledonium]
MNGQPPQQRQPQNELVAFYKEIPICTRFLFTSYLVITVLGNIGPISPYYFFFLPEYTFGHFQIWRLFTSFFFYSFNFNGAIQLYFLYRYSKEVETEKFLGITADYVFFLLFEALTILIIGGMIKGLVLFNQSLVMAIIYIWAQLFKDAIVTFMFGLRFKGVYLPFVLLAFEALQMGGGLPWASIIGIITGHIYYYLKEIYPASGGTRFLNTPQWLYNWFPVNRAGLRTSFGVVLNPGGRAQQQSSTDGTRHSWGRGQRLGS